ncbi:N-acetyl-alpha-D-glucosaminyl L-malate synthase BshA [Natranaerofaba carboxydovora]|uniref:N-acetyl-alpha-D-glucosaminyl L-malate synthase BshA n=1 Tax=Natranaerofaba carboxydovora TaxID=2742683 RepID=UPI001F138BF1|nr:N-acetyl-alpha-D-glucosaminyl L-malate synthase BshA [Natranaerofaba carboxydovora]UMZ73227.1 N-acetyl-alpha-D-glucosaminyl L-malate synthase [Natranaerofaba carboxydovora]
MKIAMICYPTHGGSGVVATELGKQLVKRGHEIHFVSYQLPFRLNDFYQNIYFHEVDVPSYPLFKYPPYSLALSSRLAELVKEYEIEVIHSHYAIPHSICANLAKDMIQENKPKVVTTLHGTDITLVGNDPSFFEITKYGMEKSDALTCVSKDLKNVTKDIFKINQNPEVIYNFIDPEEYNPVDVNPDLKEELDLEDEKLIIHISNFRPVKRVLDVIKIFNEIQKEVSSKLLMVGDGVDRRKAEMKAKEFGIEHKIKFLGKQDKINSLMAISDLLLLPSEKESFGLVALEAMAFNVPVIATNSGGLPEVIDDGVTGYLADVGDIDKMADRAVYILKNSKIQEEMGKGSRKRALDLFNADNVVRQYEKMYEQIINE